MRCRLFRLIRRFLVVILTVVVLLPVASAQNGSFRNIRHQAAPAFVFDGRQALTVMSFNIRVGYGGRDRGVDPFTLSGRGERLGPVIDAIRSRDPDIVALQEVLGADQTQRLAQALQMNYAYAGHGSGSPRPGWWGVALLSRYPIIAADDFPISFGRGDSKNALLCTIRIAGRRLTFLSIHHDRDITDSRPLERIMARIRQTNGPIVLMGDFNMLPDDRRLQLIQARFADSAAAADTHSARTARRVGTFLGVGRIDYIWADRDHFEVNDAGLADRRFNNASDHLAYWAAIIPKP